MGLQSFPVGSLDIASLFWGKMAGAAWTDQSRAGEGTILLPETLQTRHDSQRIYRENGAEKYGAG